LISFDLRQLPQLNTATRLQETLPCLKTILQPPTTEANRQSLTRVPAHVSSLFKFAFDAGLIDRPVRFEPGFKRPSKKTSRKHRAGQEKKLCTAQEIRQLLDAAGTSMKAMILLGINCAFGNADCGNLPLRDHDRPGRCP
jgi:hypothetical protein